MTLAFSRVPGIPSRPTSAVPSHGVVSETVGHHHLHGTLAAMRLREFRGPGPVDIVEEWGLQSFPASDPPANW